MDEQAGTGRRRLLEWMVQGLSGLLGLTLGGTALTYLLGGSGIRARKGWIEAASIDQLTVNAPEEIVFRRTRVDGWKISSEKQTAWLVRLGEKNVVAYSPQCTHLGCAYHFDDRKREFVCPCHTSNFALDGRVLHGPAPRPLDRYEVRIENNRVLIGGLAGEAKES